MLDIKVIRKAVKNWPEGLRKVNSRFIPLAGKMVLGSAKNNAPVDRGTLRASISLKTRKDKAIVGTGIEYAPYVEYRTRWTRAQPFMRPAIDKNKKGLLRLWRDLFRRVYG